MWQNGFQSEVVLGHETSALSRPSAPAEPRTTSAAPSEEGDRVIFSPGTGGYGAYGFYDTPDVAPHFYGGFADYIYLGFENTCMLKTSCSPEVAVLTEPYTSASTLPCAAKYSSAIPSSSRQRRHRPRNPPLRQTDGRRQHHRRRRPRQAPRLAKEFGADVTINIEEVTSVESAPSRSTGTHRSNAAPISYSNAQASSPPRPKDWATCAAAAPTSRSATSSTWAPSTSTSTSSSCAKI